VQVNQKRFGSVQLGVLLGLSGSFEGHVVQGSLDDEDRRVRRPGGGNQLEVLRVMSVEACSKASRKM